MSLIRPSTLAAIVLVGLVGVFYLSTFRHGHVWGDDHAAYLSHTRNLVEGKAYGDINYLRSPSSINPLMYPPLFPLLLAPVYLFFGPALTPMKIEGTIFFCTALFFLYLLLREHGEAIALITVAVVGLCPYFWDFKDALYSDFPFLAFAFAAMWLAGKAPLLRDSARREVSLGILVGLLIGLAFGARTVGFVLAPVIILFDCWKARTITTFGIATGAVSLFVALAPSFAFHVQSDYLTPYKQILSIRSLANSPVYYLKCFSVLWENGYSVIFQWTVYGVMGVLALKGLWTRIRSGISMLEVFFIAYFLFICLFPWGGRRYLMPIMPFYFFYILVGVRSFTPARPVALRIGLCGVLALLAGLTFLGRYSTQNWREIANGEQSADAAQLVGFLNSTEKNSGPIVFCKARWLGFQTRRLSTDPLTADNLEEIDRHYAQIGASRFVASRIFNDRYEFALNRWLEHAAYRLVPRFENDSFTVYELR